MIPVAKRISYIVIQKTSRIYLSENNLQDKILLYSTYKKKSILVRVEKAMGIKRH